MHVLVVAAVWQMHQAAELDLVWMSGEDACEVFQWEETLGTMNDHVTNKTNVIHTLSYDTK